MTLEINLPTCRVKDCKHAVKVGDLVCVQHWARVPKPLKRAFHLALHEKSARLKRRRVVDLAHLIVGLLEQQRILLP